MAEIEQQYYDKDGNKMFPKQKEWELIWENPNIIDGEVSSTPEQHIDFDTTAYRYILVIQTYRSIVEEQKYSLPENHGCVASILPIIKNIRFQIRNMGNFCRNYYIDDTGINVFNGRDNTTLNNSVAQPVYIYGIR